MPDSETESPLFDSRPAAFIAYTLIIMTKMEATQVRRHFADELSKVAYGKQPLVIERNGKALVAVIPLEDFALLEKILEKRREEREDRDDLAAYRAAKVEMRRAGEKTIEWNNLKQGRLTKAAARSKAVKRDR